jgi:hypothetical protein
MERDKAPERFNFSLTSKTVANPSLNRTRNGMAGLGLTSFWPRRVTPLRAG